MDFGRYLEAIRHDGDALVAAARDDLDAPVPSCPGWSVHDLVSHTAAVHRQKEQIVREAIVSDPPGMPEPPTSDIVAWFEEGVDMLIDTLRSTDPATPVWSWYEPDQTAGFWYRRMAQETVVHRADAELAAGGVGPIDPELARDGVSEVVDVFIAGDYPPWLTIAQTEAVIALSTTDLPGAWRLRKVSWSGTSPNTGNVYADELGFMTDDSDDPPATTVEGTSRDMLLWLWGRGPLDTLDTGGDERLVAELRQSAADATQ